MAGDINNSRNDKELLLVPPVFFVGIRTMLHLVLVSLVRSKSGCVLHHEASYGPSLINFIRKSQLLRELIVHLTFAESFQSEPRAHISYQILLG